MFVTFYYRFVAICLVWTFVVAPLVRLATKRWSAWRDAMARIPLGRAAAFLRALDAAGARAPLAAVVALLAATAIGEVEAMRIVAEYTPQDRAIEHGWPISFIITDHYFANYHLKTFGLIRLFLGLIVGLQALGLRSLWSRFTHRAPRGAEWIVLGAGAAVMYLYAIFTRTLEQPDLYGYVIFAKLGALAYTPPLNGEAYSGEFVLLDPLAKISWGVQNPSPYGPLWLLISRAAFGWMTHLLPALFTMRILTTLAVALLAFAVHRLGYGWRGALIVALNPAIIHEYVVEAHVDIVAVAFLAMGFVAVQRRPWLAAIAVVAAGLIKLPYMLIGTLVFAALEKTRVRIGLAATTVAATAALSLLFGGLPYLRGLTFHANVTVDHQPAGVLLVRAAIIGAAALALAVAVLLRRSRLIAAYLQPQLALSNYPWYVIMGFPYAMLNRVSLPIYVISLPIAIMLNDFWFNNTYAYLFALLGAVAVAVTSSQGKFDERPASV